MNRSRPLVKVLSRVLVVLLLPVLLLSVSTAAASELKFSAPKDHLLALGDSLTFGFQRVTFFSGGAADPTLFDSGFVDVFAARLGATAPGQNVQVKNFGCPGETSGSFLAGPCAYHAAGLPLHENFAGAQIDAAEAFLQDHPGQVSPILVSLGANDALDLVDACGLDPGCLGALIPGVLASLAQNYSITLARLRSRAPDAEIVVLGLYNPLALLDGGTPSNTLTALFNQVIESVATANRARFANPFPAFNLGPQPATLCTLTLMCTPFTDIHASDAGYAVLADLLWQASGYSRFEH